MRVTERELLALADEWLGSPDDGCAECGRQLRDLLTLHRHDWRHYPGNVMQCLGCSATKPVEAAL